MTSATTLEGVLNTFGDLNTGGADPNFAKTSKARRINKTLPNRARKEAATYASEHARQDYSPKLLSTPSIRQR